MEDSNHARAGEWCGLLAGGPPGYRQEGLAIAGNASNLVAESARFEECDRGGWGRMDGYGGAYSLRWPLVASCGMGRGADCLQGCGGLRRGEAALGPSREMPAG